MAAVTGTVPAACPSSIRLATAGRAARGWPLRSAPRAGRPDAVTAAPAAQARNTSTTSPQAVQRWTARHRAGPNGDCSTSAATAQRGHSAGLPGTATATVKSRAMTARAWLLSLEVSQASALRRTSTPVMPSRVPTALTISDEMTSRAGQPLKVVISSIATRPPASSTALIMPMSTTLTPGYSGSSTALRASMTSALRVEQEPLGTLQPYGCKACPAVRLVNPYLGGLLG